MFNCINIVITFDCKVIESGPVSPIRRFPLRGIEEISSLRED